MNFFNKYKLPTLILIMIGFMVPNFVSAQHGTCSPVGYKIFTINGINTSIDGATNNRDQLKRKLVIDTFNSQPLTVDFLHNPTHGQIADVIDSTYQKYNDQSLADVQDSDFAHMLIDASTKLNTQKVLLVAHSQGNFYANTFYDDVIDRTGGIPNESIGVYGVATPANRVAGNGAYLTSDTDTLIAGIVAKALGTNILTPNIHIDFKNTDDAGIGHDFSKIYLNYQGDKIVTDIKNSLTHLKNNTTQKADAPCILPPKLTLAQKIQGTALAIVDPVSIPIQKGIVSTTTGLYAVGRSISNGYLAFIQGAGDLLADTLGGIIHRTAGAVVLSEDESIPIIHTPTDNSQNNSKTVAVNILPTPPVTTSKIITKIATDTTPILVINTKDSLNSAPIVLADNTPKLFVNTPRIATANLGGGGGQTTPENPPSTPPDPVVTDPVIPDPIIPPPDPIIPPPPDPDPIPPVVTPPPPAPRVPHEVVLPVSFPASSTTTQTIIYTEDWTPADNPHIVTGELQLSPGSILTIEPGTIIKFADANSYILINNATLKAEGTLSDKIYFTSIKDDSVGGDINGDGGATSPQAEDWRGIYITGDGSFSSSISNAVVRYAGSSDYPAIYISNENLSIADSVIKDNGNIGIYETHHIIYSTPMDITNTEISNQDYGIYLDIGYGVPGLINMHNSNIHDNSIFGFYSTPYGVLLGDNNYWGDASGPQNDISNSAGLGQKVFGENVFITPWLTSAP